MTAFERHEKRIKIVIVLVLAFLNFLPICWLIMTPLRPPDKLLITSLSDFVFPSEITFERFWDILSNQYFRRFLMNSLIVAISSTSISLMVSVFGGYSLARLNFWGKAILGRGILFTYVVAEVLLVVPMFVMFAKLGLHDTYFGLILAHTALGVPFSMWLLRGFFMSLPKELEEAACIDGTTRIGALFRVMLPLAMPGVGAAALFVFILSWNDYLFALVFISKSSLKTLPYGVASTWMTLNMEPITWSRLMTASLLSAIPIVIIFLLLQKVFVQGMTVGAVKG